MLYFSIALISLMLGIYAGKRMEKGEGWCQILCDMFYDLYGAMRTFWVDLTNPFRAKHEVAEADGNPA